MCFLLRILIFIFLWGAVCNSIVQKILECGVKKSSGDRTASLFLSKKLGRWPHGFEYGALEVKCHLERLLFSDIISRTLIRYQVSFYFS